MREPSDLRRHRLLNVYPARRDWLDAVGLDDLSPDPTAPSFDSYLLALEEAAAGAGVSLATEAFVADDLASGRLVAPFDVKVASRAPWYFVCPKERRSEPRIALFRKWLQNTVATAATGQCLD